jgi:hypothetical protein
VIYRLQGASLGAVLYIKLPPRITNEERKYEGVDKNGNVNYEERNERRRKKKK